jgi:tyrosine-protein phosphatase SIW14
MVAPPTNFAMVSPGVYRSGFPTHHNQAFLQRLGLRTIVNLADEPGLAQRLEVVTCAVSASREPFVVPQIEEVHKALSVLLDQRRHPVLIHSLRGDSAVSVIIGVLRRLQRWSLSAIFDEYRRFASSGAAMLLDLQVIECFELPAVTLRHEPPNDVSACEAADDAGGRGDSSCTNDAR